MLRRKGAAASVMIVALASSAAAQAAQSPAAAPVAATKPDDPPAPITLLNQPAATSVFTFDYGVPTSPALQLAGLSPDKTTTSTSLKPFVLALPTFLSGSGTGQAAALDVSPVAMFQPGLTYKSYRELGPVMRALYRTRLGLAGYRGVEDADPSKAKSSKIAASVSASLLDFSDPTQTGRMDGTSFWERCTNAAIQAYTPSTAAQNANQEAATEAAVRLAQVDQLAIDLTTAINQGPPGRAEHVVTENAALIASVLGPDTVAAPKVEAAPIAAAGAAHRDLSKAEVLQWLQEEADKSTSKDATSLLVARSIVQAAKESAPPAPPSAAPLAVGGAIAGMTPTQIRDALQARHQALNDRADTLAAAANKDLVTEAAKAGYTTAITTCTKKSNAEAMAEAALDIGGGALWNGRPGEFDNFDNGGGATWLGYRLPLLVKRERTGVAAGLVSRDKDDRPIWALTLGGSLRYAWRDQVATGDKTTPAFSANTLDIWTGLQWVTTASKFDLQYGHYKADATSDNLSNFNRSGDRWLASAAFRLSEEKTGMWANITYGEAHGSIKSLDDKTLLVTLSYGPVDIPALFASK